MQIVGKHTHFLSLSKMAFFHVLYVYFKVLNFEATEKIISSTWLAIHIATGNSIATRDRGPVSQKDFKLTMA